MCSYSTHATGDNCVVCSCGVPAVLLTVRNPASSNLGKERCSPVFVTMLKLVALGRQFYKCSKRDGGCDFFLWADSPSSGGATTLSSHHTGGSSQSFGGSVVFSLCICIHSYVYLVIHRSTVTGCGSDPTCRCGLKAIK